MVRAVKTEVINESRRATRSTAQNVDEAQGTANADEAEGNVGERRVLRSKYLRFKNRISGKLSFYAFVLYFHKFLVLGICRGSGV